MKKMLLVGVVGLSALLGGCANTELETSVQNLSNKVDQLAQDVSAVRADQSKIAADVADAKAEAARANRRLDNMATSYKK
ncbi:Lpp/OprI family alanine-zipper lipoprotein [Aeromonas schubertii]|uniref:Major outer membrane lipoprotein Lpp n=1 Tax=Aeromonas schubertii TaxID=652 RepID=A0A0S2SE52_9GAMM|nr:Lpp/OprI family alanine-zipper lipoprotein [Aeromonas schubertii]ALP39974.1 outer membrane lipoprotein [Aeromonas schubertii]